MLTDKKQSFKIHRKNILQSRILCMAKLSRIKQLPLMHPFFLEEHAPQKWKSQKNPPQNNNKKP